MNKRSLYLQKQVVSRVTGVTYKYDAVTTIKKTTVKPLESLGTMYLQLLPSFSKFKKNIFPIFSLNILIYCTTNIMAFHFNEICPQGA